MKRKLFSMILAVLMIFSAATSAISAFAAPALPTSIYDWDKAMNNNVYNGYRVPLRVWLYPGEQATIQVTRDTSRIEKVYVDWYAASDDSSGSNPLGNFAKHDVSANYKSKLKPGNYSKNLKITPNGAKCTIKALKPNMSGKSGKHFYGEDKVVAYIRTYDSNNKLTSSFLLSTDIAIYNR